MRLFCYHLFICLIFLQVIACGGSSEKDSIAPVITLNGESAIELILDGTYVELGATAIDDIDGEIAVIISGEVVTNTIGNYTITYTATDKSGNVSNKKRLIEVIHPTHPVITMEEDKDVIKGKLASIHAVVTDEGPLGSLQLQWRQVTNESLELIDDTTSTLKFQVPYIDDETILTFQLTAINKYGESASKEINITVQPLFKGIHTIAADSKVSVIRSATHLQHADMDSDGDEDLLLYSEYNHNIIWLVNDEASFNRPIIVEKSICEQKPSFYDFDKDGKLDILCSTKQGIYFIRNLNNLSFSTPKLIYTTTSDLSEYVGMAFGDLNNDGKTDVVLSEPTSNYASLDVFALFNNSDNELDNKTLIVNTPYFEVGHGIPHIFDANGDEFLDILLTPTFNSLDFKWFENKGNSGFVEHLFPIKGRFDDFSQLVFTASFGGLKDWDHDGDMDLIANGDGGLYWLENLNQNNFVAHLLGGENSGLNRFFGKVTDWDGDGDYDFIHTNSDYWFENIGNNQFIGNSHPKDDSTEHNNSLVKLVDVDSDGLDDFVRLDIGIDALSWKKNINGASFGSDNIISDFYRLYGIEDLVSADFDGDGDVDIISVSYIKDRLKLHKNDGAGKFNETSAISTGNNDDLYEIKAVDWEGDGDIDLIYKHINKSYYLNEFMLLKNNGLGGFSLPEPLKFEVDFEWYIWSQNDNFILKDLNQDNLQDLVFTKRQYPNMAIVIYTQTPQNTLRLQSTSEFVATMSNISLANIDGDDDLDIVSTGESDLNWFEFVDPQTIEHSVINTAPYYSRVYTTNVFDMDSDGDSDFVSKNELLINNNSVLSQMESIPFFISNKNKYLDMDFDGDIDVIGARVSTEGLPIWSEATGPFEFLQHQSTSSNKEYPTTVADFDGDGDLDIALAHTDEQKIIFVKNQYTQEVSKNN